MKNLNKKLLGIIYLFACLCLVSCEENEEFNSNDEYFNGTARLKGVVYFNNIITNSIDTARTAKLTLSKSKSSKSEYVKMLTDGTFDIQFLSKGTYEIELRYEHITKTNEITKYYKIIQEINLEDDQLLDLLDLKLEIDNTSLETPTLRLTIKDALGAIISNAQVCLFSDSSLMVKNRKTCLGNTRTGVTNQQGVVFFDNLEERRYFVSSFKIIGKDTLITSTSMPVSVGPLKSGILNDKEFTIQPIIPVVSTTLEFSIQDSAGASIPNTRVCIFSNRKLLNKYRRTCDGSLRSDITNSQGVVKFENLQAINYYAAAFKVVGKDTLSNKHNDQIPFSPVLPNQINKFNILIK
jgi:hypothetical protein